LSIPAGSTDCRDAAASLVLVRHGESEANVEGRWAGWRDVALTGRGREQAVAAVARLRDAGLQFACVLTSMLQRAIATADALLVALGKNDLERRECWRLNERHAGMMQGRSKAEVKAAYGRELARSFRRSWAQAPPPVEPGSADDPATDPRYAGCADQLPRSEAMSDVAARVLPLWRDVIAPRLRAGENLLVVGHAMSLRALARPVEGLTGPELPPWKLASAVPRWYRLDAALRPIGVKVLGDAVDVPDE